MANMSLGSKYERNLPAPILDRKCSALVRVKLLNMNSSPEDDFVKSRRSTVHDLYIHHGLRGLRSRLFLSC